MNSLVILLALCSVALLEEVRYDNHNVYDIHGVDEKQYVMIDHIAEKHHLDIWTYSQQDSALQIMATEEEMESYLYMVNSTMFHRNVQTMIDASPIVPYEHNEQDRQLEFEGMDPFYDQYRSMDDLIGRMKSLCSASSDCTPIVLGKSVEGRDIEGVTIGSGSKKEIFMNGGIHAREWVSPMTTMYLMEKTLEGYASNPKLSPYIWTYVLILNPDGRVTTETGTRMWRKNRSRNQGGSRGVDLNRNFDYGWNTGGSSGNPASDTYHGTKALSEPESQALRNYVCGKNGNVILYADIHTSGNMFMTPWGNTRELPPTYETMMGLVRASAKEIERTHNTRWAIGSSANVIYIASGGTDDTMHAMCEAKYSHCLELRGPGFSPPATAIKLSCEEIWNGVLEIGNYINQNG